MNSYREIQRPRGFTLLEMVIAIAIFAVIAAVLYPSMQRFIEAREQLGERGLVLAELQSTMLFLANDFRFALDRDVRDDYGDPEDAFATDIESDELFRLTTAYPDIGVYGSSVPKRVAWTYDGDNLLRHSWRVLDRVSNSEASTRHMLAGVSRVRVRFAQRGNNDIDWDTDWSIGGGMPLAVEIVLEMEDGAEFRRVVEMPGGNPGEDGDEGES